MALSFIEIIGLIGATILLAGIIILLIKGGPAVRWFFGILLLLLVVGFFGLFSIHFVSRPQAVTDWPAAVTERPKAALVEGSPSPVQVQGVVIHIDKDPTVWAEGLEEELTPDVYSSIEAAAYGLGVQLEDSIANALNNESLRKIIILDTNVSQSLQEQLRRGLSKVYESVPIVINKDMDFSPGTISIKMDSPPSNVRALQQLEVHNDGTTLIIPNVYSPKGTLNATVIISDDKHFKEVKYDHPIWLYDTDTFRSKVMNNGQWAVITTNETAITKQQARQELYNNATKYVYECLLASGPLKRNLLQSDLTTYGLIVDEYDQRLQGLSGPIWRSAILLDVSPERMQMLRQDKLSSHRLLKSHLIFQVFSLAGMLVLISILYLFVNAITKGYYAIPIFIAAIIAFLVFLVLFMA